MVDGIFSIRLFREPGAGLAAPIALDSARVEGLALDGGGAPDQTVGGGEWRVHCRPGKSPRRRGLPIANRRTTVALQSARSLWAKRHGQVTSSARFGGSRWNVSGDQTLEGAVRTHGKASRGENGQGAASNKNNQTPGESVVYSTASEFSQSVKAAIEADTPADFRREKRGSSLLVIEDLTQLANRRVAQQELLHTLDVILDHQGQVIFTSRVMPEKIPGLSPALCSRLSGGLAVPLAPPATAARLACIERFAQARNVDLPAPAVRLLASGLSVTVPELFGAVTELHMQSQLDGQPLDAARVRRWLADRQLRLRPSLRMIARLSAKYFGLRVTELTSPSRRRNVVQARAVAMYLARQLTGKSLEQVGTHFGGRDHTTVLHNCRSIESRVRGDPTTRRAVGDIRKMLAHV